MLKTIALIGLAAALAVPSAPAFAVSGNSSAYGTDGSGPTVPTQSLTPFQRSWNHANESKERARAGASLDSSSPRRWPDRNRPVGGRDLAPPASGEYSATSRVILDGCSSV